MYMAEWDHNRQRPTSEQSFPQGSCIRRRQGILQESKARTIVIPEREVDIVVWPACIRALDFPLPISESSPSLESG
jgi:hypothetical protein